MCDEEMTGAGPVYGPTARARARIAEIDAMFESATSWGSWMVGCANEREALADQIGVPHKYQARTASGGRTD